jgi:hypothetical protein
MDDRSQRIREIAYRLWEEEGRPRGRADEHWRQAAALVEAEEAIAERSDPPPPRESAPASPLPPAALETRSAAAPALPIDTTLSAGKASDRQNSVPPQRATPARTRRSSRPGGDERDRPGR